MKQQLEIIDIDFEGTFFLSVFCTALFLIKTHFRVLRTLRIEALAQRGTQFTKNNNNQTNRNKVQKITSK